ncbi:MAG: tetratricopeptide repeat protein [Ardenticatenaceae bacterium]|nr:tetratricopeptide repeat protein [Ardenticatenaceae bacterium]
MIHNQHMGHLLRIRLFGGLFIELNGQPVTGIKTQKEALLLAYLALGQQPYTRETLATLLWDERDQARAMSNLRTLLSRLRKTVGDYVQIERQTVAIQADKVWVDVLAFSNALTIAREDELGKAAIAELETAVSLAVGHFLAGVSITDSEGLQAWQMLVGEQLYEQVIAVRRQLAQHYLSNGRDMAKGIEHARAYVTLAPLHEEAHQLLMRLLVRDGQRNAALQQYQVCAAILAQELDIEPSAEMNALYERIQAGTFPPPHCLPAEPRPFVGRAAELALIDHYLDDPNGRLLTIFGPGGAGKTRLAVQAADQRQGEFLHGIIFVPLAALTAASHLPIAIGNALGLQFAGQAPAQTQLLQFLQTKEMLLLLDNLEQLLNDSGTVSLIQMILAEAPEVKLIITSRERLRLRAEQVVPVTGLSFSDTEAVEPAQFEAVHFFQQCAAWQGVETAVADTPTVMHICRLLEGLPLAIELAAAMLDVYSLAEINAQIQSNLDFLTTYIIDMPPRQQSIRAVFDHSWQLLNVAEQKALAQLSVFQSGFSRSMGTDITTASVSILQKLVHKSLLRLEGDGRYRMHPLLQQFAAEQLSQLGVVAEETAAQHGRYYLNFVAQQAPQFHGLELSVVMAAMQQDNDNIEAAWQWGIRHTAWDALHPAIPGMSHYYRHSHLYETGANLFGQAAQQLRPQAQNPSQQAIIARLLLEQSFFLGRLGHFETVITIAQEVIALAAVCQSPDMEAEARYRWARALYTQGQYAAAEEQLAPVLNGPQDQIHPLNHARLLTQKGHLCFFQGQLQPAHQWLEEALAVYQAEGDKGNEAKLLHQLGEIALHMQVPDQAVVYLQQALTIAQARDDKELESNTIATLGNLSLDAGDYVQAMAYYTQVLHTAQQYGIKQIMCAQHVCLGTVMWHLGLYEQADVHYQSGYRLAKELDLVFSQATTLVSWAYLAYSRGQWSQAISCAQQALTLMEPTSGVVGDAYHVLGNALTATKRWDEAKAAYQAALYQREQAERSNFVLETLAALAHLALVRGQIDQARVYAERIIIHLQPETVAGADEPLRIYWWTYQALAAANDARAAEVLKSGYEFLQMRAAKIDDDLMRRSYLQNVAVHRDIMMAYEERWAARSGSTAVNLNKPRYTVLNNSHYRKSTPPS